MAKLLKGGDTTLSLSQGGVELVLIKDIADSNVVVEVDTIDEDHLGHSGPDIDDYFNGCSGDFEMHLDSDGYLQLFMAVTLRAQNRTPNLSFDISIILSFPSGQTRLVTFRDVKFKPFNLANPNRKQHVKGKVQWRCGDLPAVIAM